MKARVLLSIVVLPLAFVACAPDSGESEPRPSGSPTLDVPPPAVEVSGACDSAMEALAAGNDVDATDPLMSGTLSACADVPEWLGAVQIHPEAFEVTKATQVGRIEIQTACQDENLDLPVCADADDRGLL